MTAGTPIVPLPNLANFSGEINLARVTAQRDKLLAACRELLACHPNELVPGRVFDRARAAIAEAEVTP